MLTIFVSHQWLGATLPDPKGQQLAVLRNALLRMIEGSLSVDHDLVSMRPGAESLPAAIRSRLSTGYIFLDWFAIPQLTARQEGTNEDRTQTDAALAIQSIPAYVEVADVFVALVPELTHRRLHKAHLFALVVLAWGLFASFWHPRSSRKVFVFLSVGLLHLDHQLLAVLVVVFFGVWGEEGVKAEVIIFW